MNIVIVKHENCGQKFLFQVPQDRFLRAGDLVRVRTRKGLSLASCLCDSFEVDESGQEVSAICMAFGTTAPLQPVVGKYEYYDFGLDDSTCERIIL